MEWINSNKGYVLYKEKSDGSPMRCALVGKKSTIVDTSGKASASLKQSSVVPSPVEKPVKSETSSPKASKRTVSPKRTLKPTDSSYEKDVSKSILPSEAESASISEEGGARLKDREEEQKSEVSSSYRPDRSSVKESESSAKGSPSRRSGSDSGSDDGNIKEEDDDGVISDDDEDNNGMAKPSSGGFMSVQQILYSKVVSMANKKP